MKKIFILILVLLSIPTVVFAEDKEEKKENGMDKKTLTLFITGGVVGGTYYIYDQHERKKNKEKKEKVLDKSSISN